MIENEDVALSGRLRAIDVPQSRHARALERNGRKHLTSARGIALDLNDLDLHVVPNRVVGPDCSIDHSAVVELAVDIFQEVRRRDGRLRRVDLHRDRPELRVEDDDNGRRE